MRTILSKLSLVLIIFLIVYLPFQGLVLGLLESAGLSEGMAFWSSHFYEAFLLLALGLTFILQYKKILESYFLAGAYLLLILGVLGILSGGDIGRGLEGFRLTLLPLAIFILALSWPVEKAKREQAEKAFLLVSILIAGWAIFERFLPPNYWRLLGLDNFGYGNFMAGDNFFRSSSFLGGPNQLGSYLLPAFFLMLFRAKQFAKTHFALILLLFILAILASFSRAALLGLLLPLAVLFIVQRIENARRLGFYSLGAALLVAGGGWLYFHSPAFKDFVLHGQSQALHWSAMKDSINYLGTMGVGSQLFGGGLGTAGPLAVKYGQGLISESWYLQLLLEIGVFGLALWLMLIALMLVCLYKKKATGYFYGLISLLITASFLHTFADNPAVSFSVFALIGLALNKSSLTVISTHSESAVGRIEEGEKSYHYG